MERVLKSFVLLDQQGAPLCKTRDEARTAAGKSLGVYVL